MSLRAEGEAISLLRQIQQKLQKYIIFEQFLFIF